MDTHQPEKRSMRTLLADRARRADMGGFWMRAFSPISVDLPTPDFP
jgi:hypothetical protein